MKQYLKIISEKFKLIYLVRAVLLCSSVVLPALCVDYFGNSNAINVFDYLWVGFYSALFTCLFFKSWIVKAVVIIINIGTILTLMLFFLMGGAEIIPGIILKAILPFVHNPWI